MAYPLQERYINLLTDFGFKRVFGSEPNKQLLIDFLNTLLPERHRIQKLSYKSTENLGNTPIDRKAIFDIYCQGENGERFIVEIQKAKQNFFKDRSVFYASFPIQEQSLREEWNFQLAPVYSIGILDFIFDDHQHEATLIHTVELKNQHCDVFYDKLKFIYVELPKFKKTLDQLETHQDKWLYLLRHLPELDDQPRPFQDAVFLQLFEIAEISNFSPREQESYQSSLKYYRDLNNVIDTSRQEGIEEGRQAEKMAIALALLSKLPNETISQTTGLPITEIERLRNGDE
ncbi:Rpn family recombination-promoting nuclease/putative transposase [Leptolyngbya sp. BC1307]|uniref:Rpn family recombination-promoting nuclease/putative transposase n=1 Tax=Leptolyngbya sp. BC1307 TaxID=2029589 RepID=UPI000EFBA6EB|nr:Rpn family recombination-promoting nuclease/putative transposase [Leptolyngbya sp. BC1307]